MPQDNESNITKVNTPAPFTTDQLLKMLLDSQSEAAKANKQLAEAILEARKPYESPQALQQKADALEERKKSIALQLRQKEETKKACPHIREDGRLNIKWHEHSNGVTLGVCGQCFSQFDTRNPEDMKLLRQDPKAIRNMGRSGSHARRGAGLSTPLSSI